MNNILEKSQEFDLNPFIIFNQDAKVIKYNQEAEYLLSFVDAKEIFKLAMSYAPLNYGFKNSYISIEFNRVKYYAILVGYEDEEYLAVKLYKEVTHKEMITKKIDTTQTSIYTLLELSINTSLNSNIQIKTEYDPSIIETYIRVKEMMLLLNNIFSIFKDLKEIYIKVGVKIGAKLLVEDKRYPVCTILVKSDTNLTFDTTKLEQYAKEADAILFFNKNSIAIEFALVT